LKGARLLVNTLEERGAKVVFGIPGGTNLPLYDEMRESNLTHILARHECSAAHMADGYARASGRIGTCLGTSGPGATNMITGICTAYMDSSPVLCLTGQVSTKLVGNDAFQEADVFDLMIHVTKWNFRVRSPEEIPQVISSSITLATSGRYGPVAVDLPTDTISSETEDYTISEINVEMHTDLSDLGRAVYVLNSCSRPVILAGGGAKWSGCGPLLLQFAEKLGAPVVTTVMGKGTVPEDHCLVLGTTGMHGRGSSALALREADTIIAIGTRFSDRTTGKTGSFAAGKRVIHIDIDAAEIGKNLKDVVGLSGDCGAVISLLLPLIKGRDRSEWLAKISTAREFCKCDYNLLDAPLKPQKIIYEMNRVLPDDTILTTDVGQHQMFAAHFFEIRGRRRFITSGGLGTMGFGLPAAIGAKIASGNSTVVCLAGDGGFQMTMAEFATAVENNIKVLVVIMNNSSLGMVRQFQKHFYGNNIFAVDYSRTPDFVKFAEAMGGDGVIVERQSEVEEALKRGLKSEVPFIADMRVDINEDCLPMKPPWADANGTIYGRCKWRDVIA